jgi:rhodanese-related sulfurtransferase
LKTPFETLNELKNLENIILDVRTMGEQSKAPLHDALHIPADEIRDRLSEIPMNKTVFLLSKDGFLGHTTLQILKANGWTRVYNIAGGYLAARWIDGWNFNT